MKILYYDCFSGISGDMNLGVMVDLGVDKEYLINELSKLQLDNEFEIKITNGSKKGITGTKVDIILTHQRHCDMKHQEENPYDTRHYDNLAHSGRPVHSDIENNEKHVNEIQHNHEDQTDEIMHNNENRINDTGDNHEDQRDETEHSNKDRTDNIEHFHNRYLKDIRAIIDESDLSDNVKSLSMDIFMKIAVAESKVHGKSLEEVHFHEVGAIDSIVDIVGAAISIDYLKVDKIMSSPVQVGGGFVKCAHGIIPVPVPATVEILKGVPLRFGIVQFETTTPTGAAILATIVEEYTDKIEFSIDKVGYGLGNRDLDIPNVLRAYLGTTISDINEEQYILETNIDDMNPELYSYIEEKLFESGALDVYKTPIIMKKGRPAVKLSILVNNICKKNVLDIIFKETTSIGVRKYNVEKLMLQRTQKKIKTKFGEITIKNSYYNGELVKYKPEYEDCKRLAKENNVPISIVYKEVDRVIDKEN